MIDPKNKKEQIDSEEEIVFDWNKSETNNDNDISSNGSASAFDETESVNEDNFDDLREK